MFKVVGVLGLLSLIVQLLLNRCWWLVSNLGVKVVASVPQPPVSDYHGGTVDENDSLCNRTKKMHRVPQIRW